MDARTLFAVVVGLIIVAFGGFYVALGPRGGDGYLPPRQSALPPSPASPVTAAPSPTAAAPLTAVPVETPAVPAVQAPAQPSLPSPPPPMATPESVEAEITLSDYAEVAALLKQNFAAEYGELIAAAVRKRNDGVSGEAFGQDLAERLQAIMRGKLKYGVGASTPTIDRLAANEASLFHALGTEGAGFCLKMLGKDDTPAEGTPPENVRKMMGLGTLYRFQAIVEGLPDVKPVEGLKADEMKAFEASLAHEGLNFKDVSSGAYLKTAGAPGKPCLTLETLHLAIARLPEGTRRKIYAGMFFAGRDK